jgi:di/tricarboxylate transporter
MAPPASLRASDFRPEAFLMATAIGAGCDFLTPIGHSFAKRGTAGHHPLFKQ